MRGPLSTLLVCLATLLPLCARAQMDQRTPILVVFGDSVADTGNSAAITRGLEGVGVAPPSEYYYDDRYTNGRNWVDHFQNKTEWDILNYAVGGTTACDLSNDVLPYNASLNDQVSRFLEKQVPWKDQDAPEESMRLLNSYRPLVIAVVTGNNDFHIVYNQAYHAANDTGNGIDTIDQAMQLLIDDNTLNATNIARCYMGAVSRLLPSDEEDVGIDLRRVRGMGLFGPAAVHQTPLALGDELLGFSNTTQVAVGGVVESLNSILEIEISELDLPSGVRAEFINLADFQQKYANGDYPEFAANPITEDSCLDVVGIPGVDSVINGTCEDASNYQFYDEVHPTTTTHEALAVFSMEAFMGAASGLMSAPADERSGEVTITMEIRVTGYSGKALRTNEQQKRIDLFNRLSSAVALNLAYMRPELMLVGNATELHLVEPASQRRALKQDGEIAGPCVECVQNEIIKEGNVFSSPEEEFVPIKITVLLPDDTDADTLEDFVAEIQSEGTNIFRGSGEESNIGIDSTQGDGDSALRSLASVTMCIASVLSAIMLTAL